jgi:3-carboxy-cis,cis-muconate cycloisomerase
MFDELYASDAVRDATGPVAWLQAMLDVEAALARVGAATGRVPAEAAAAIVERCRADRFDVADLARRAVDSATPVVPLVEDLRAAVPPAARAHVHAGATSQDIVDTAAMLVARRSLAPVRDDLTAAADRLAGLAAEHRHTVQIGRTLLRQAVPTTFGAVAAGWLVGVDEARARLDTVDRYRLAVQYGGPVGVPGDPAVPARLAAELGLAEPVAPWHTDRGRIGELAAALAGAAGALGKVAGDVLLLAQSEIGELSEAGGPAGSGASSAMPHKRNAAAAVLVVACAHRAPGLVATLLAAAPQELQRAAGRWQAEWGTLTDLLRVTSGAAAHARRMVDRLRVDPDRMRANLDATGDPAEAPDRGAVDDLVDRALAAHKRTAADERTATHERTAGQP